MCRQEILRHVPWILRLAAISLKSVQVVWASVKQLIWKGPFCQSLNQLSNKPKGTDCGVWGLRRDSVSYVCPQECDFTAPRLAVLAYDRRMAVVPAQGALWGSSEVVGVGPPHSAWHGSPPRMVVILTSSISVSRWRPSPEKRVSNSSPHLPSVYSFQLY